MLGGNVGKELDVDGETYQIICHMYDYEGYVFVVLGVLLNIRILGLHVVHQSCFNNACCSQDISLASLLSMLYVCIYVLFNADNTTTSGSHEVPTSTCCCVPVQVSAGMGGRKGPPCSTRTPGSRVPTTASGQSLCRRKFAAITMA